MQTYVVRVYRMQEGHPRELIGVVEEPGRGLPLAFSNVDELWAILSVPVTAGPNLDSGK
jgi:hypothetical protein